VGARCISTGCDGTSDALAGTQGITALIGYMGHKMHVLGMAGSWGACPCMKSAGRANASPKASRHLVGSSRTATITATEVLWGGPIRNVLGRERLDEAFDDIGLDATVGEMAEELVHDEVAGGRESR
jgi:hypothetical protein